MRRCFDLIASAAAVGKSPAPLGRKKVQERERERGVAGERTTASSCCRSRYECFIDRKHENEMRPLFLSAVVRRRSLAVFLPRRGFLSNVKSIRPPTPLACLYGALNIPANSSNRPVVHLGSQADRVASLIQIPPRRDASVGGRAPAQGHPLNDKKGKKKRKKKRAIVQEESLWIRRVR